MWHPAVGEARDEAQNNPSGDDPLPTAVAAPPRSSAFYPAEDHFNSRFTLRERVIAQTLLIGADLQNAVPTVRFSIGTSNATRDFQADNGLVPTGAKLDPADLADAAKIVSGLVVFE